MTNYLERINGRHYLRRRVPAAQTPRFGKSVIKKSLGTSDPREARIRLHREMVEIDEQFASLAVGDECGGGECASAADRPRRGAPASSPTSSIAAAAFIADRKDRWGRKTLLEYKAILPIIIELLGDKRITNITRPDCRRLKDVFPKIPTN